jgi:hypothetical protein
MPKQPTWEDLGGTPGIAGARPVGTYDVDAYARGAEKIAKAGEHFGAAVEGFGEAANAGARQRAHSELTYQSATTYARLIDLRSQLRNDPNYDTLEQRWHDGAHAIIEDGAGGISQPLLRERFQGTMGVHVAQEGAAIHQHAFLGAADAHAARREQLLQHAERNSSLDPNDQLLTGEFDAIHAGIDDAVARNYLTPEAARIEKSNAALRLGIAHYTLMSRADPDRAIRELGSDDSPNPNVRFFPASVKDGLLAQAESNQRAKQVDAERDPALAAERRQRAALQAQSDHLRGIFGGVPGVATSVANDETLTPESRDRLLAATRRTLQPDPPVAVSNANAMKLLERIRGYAADD